MKPPPFRLARPSAVEQVVSLLRDEPEAKVLAGGQSLVPLLNLRLAAPPVLVDLSRVTGLSELRLEDGDLVVPAMARQLDVERSGLVQRYCPLLVQALRHVGHVQVRSRGTVAGSIAHADVAAELPAVALALGARMIAISADGRREIHARSFFQGPFQTALEPDELLVEVRFPSTDGARTDFVEISRRTGDFPLVGLACVVTGRAEHPDNVALAVTGVSPVPHRLHHAEALLKGQRLSDALDEAAEAAAAEVTGRSDIHADAEYRRDLVAVLLRRALRTPG